MRRVLLATAAALCAAGCGDGFPAIDRADVADAPLRPLAGTHVLAPEIGAVGECVRTPALEGPGAPPLSWPFKTRIVARRADGALRLDLAMTDTRLQRLTVRSVAFDDVAARGLSPGCVVDADCSRLDALLDVFFEIGFVSGQPLRQGGLVIRPEQATARARLAGWLGLDPAEIEAIEERATRELRGVARVLGEDHLVIVETKTSSARLAGGVVEGASEGLVAIDLRSGLLRYAHVRTETSMRGAPGRADADVTFEVEARRRIAHAGAEGG